MLLIALTWLYGRLGHRYPKVFLVLEMLTAFPVAALSLGMFWFYYEGTAGEFALILAVVLGTTAIAISGTLAGTLPMLTPVSRWIAGERDPESTERAWAAAGSIPLRMIRRYLWIPVVVAVIPSCVVTIAVLDFSPLGFVPLFAGSMVAIGYVAILHYLALEVGMRPVLLEINRHGDPRESPDFPALPLRWRMGISLPLINLITGLVVASLTTEGGGGLELGLDVLLAVAVATTISLELSLLLSRSIVTPIGDLREAVAAVNRGDFDVSVPVTTGDELGELTASFNRMITGLAERERIREAFGTYLDKEVADYILSEGFDERGIEREVTVMFCDVRDFTEFASDATPQEIVASLNRLFERVVPIIASRGGHVDKFVGDGLVAVFGAPEPFADHAERAVRAACEIAHEINRPGGGRGGTRAGAEGDGTGSGDLRVGIGINSGSVIAGSIGGGGRLDFSVIGSPVNVASRTEKATRDTGDDVLMTSFTWELLDGSFEASSRGEIELRGIDYAIELFAPRLPSGPSGSDGGAAGSTRDGRRRGRQRSDGGADGREPEGHGVRSPLSR